MIGPEQHPFLYLCDDLLPGKVKVSAREYVTKYNNNNKNNNNNNNNNNNHDNNNNNNNYDLAKQEHLS